MQNATDERPRAGAPPERQDHQLPEDGGKAPRRLRVLVIDDEPLIGTTLRILLDDHDVTVVTSGRAARELLGPGGQSFDAILCDLMLDDISGMDLSQWLSTARPELAERVVFMTGGAFTEEARRFLRGIPRRRQLEKPFSSGEILGVLAAF